MDADILSSKVIDELLESVIFDIEEIKKFTSDQEFMKIAVDLLIEIGEITTLLCSILPKSDTNYPRKLNRNESILAGLLTRVRKMQIEILDANQRENAESVQIFIRCLCESIINLIFLLKKKEQPEVFDQFITHSLKSEKELLDKINDNILKRSGKELPIEIRMKRSILKSFKLAEIDPSSVDADQRQSDWMKLSLFKRAQEIGMEEQYLAAFAMPCHEVHGNWQDLIRHHLKHDDEGYTTKWDHYRHAPQFIIVTTVFSCLACAEYLNLYLPKGKEKTLLSEKIELIFEKSRALDNLHEKFVQQNGNIGQ